MTTKQNPIDLDACELLLHAAQTGQSFEDYSDRVIQAARAKCKMLARDLRENEMGRGKRK
jgi:hypothetical protein